ncbi:MAG: zf-HC2 domain-containing protein [Treponema sp.]|nr:zf-HC2 domain-containing protein [Treponema sp.]MEE3435533.1 zf-HC2 domain-containing protein [Treponema sp.]
MFHCPENDIHSIYLDGELPQNFVKDYEEHLASCASCRAKLEKLKAVHEAFKADARSIDVSDSFKAASFDRLQSRMRFSQSVKASEPNKNIVRIANFVPLAAAAAAVFALMLPVKMGSGQKLKGVDESVLAISAVKPRQSIADSGIIVDGAITNVALGKDAEAPLTIKASDFESLKSDSSGQEDGLTISVTKLTSLNSISASNVSNARLDTLDFLK